MAASQALRLIFPLFSSPWPCQDAASPTAGVAIVANAALIADAASPWAASATTTRRTTASAALTATAQTAHATSKPMRPSPWPLRCGS